MIPTPQLKLPLRFSEHFYIFHLRFNVVNKNKIYTSLVVAAAQNGVIGRNNELPWRLPKDLAYFKKITTGKVVLMGRNTFESIGKPLPNRTNVVISRQPEYCAEGTIVVHSLQEGLQYARNLTQKQGGDELMVIGGAQIYRESASVADRIYMTWVRAEVDGDAYFRIPNAENWQEVWSENHSADDKNPYDYSFSVLERKNY